MARPLRVQAPGLTYHITARGNRRQSMFLDAVDRRRFLAYLARVVDHYALQCHAYCLMSTHYHVVLTTKEANLSRAMQQLDGDYARWWNWRHRQVGHLFEGRFKSQIVQEGRYFLNACRYVVLNPVRARMTRTPAQWPWSSYRATAGLVSAPPFLCCDALLAGVSPGQPEAAVTRFREFVLEVNPLESRIPGDTILGDDWFVVQFQPHRDRASREVPGHDARPALESFLRGAVTRTARNAAVREAYRARYAIADIARHLELHRSTVSKIVSGADSR